MNRIFLEKNECLNALDIVIDYCGIPFFAIFKDTFQYLGYAGDYCSII